MLLGLAGWFSGFDGSFTFENIGDSYTQNHVPYVGIRALPAALGALTVPIVYQIMKESGYSTVVAAFSSILVLLGLFISVYTYQTHSIFIFGFSRQRSYCTRSSYTPRRSISVFYGPFTILLCSFPKVALLVR